MNSSKLFAKYLIVMFILCTHLELQAQEEALLADTIIHYSLQTKDTISKIPTKKIVQKFDEVKGLIKSFDTWIWRLNQRQWGADKRVEFSYFTNETVANIYQVENGKQLIQIARLIIQKDTSKQRTTEWQYLKKDRYNPEFTLWSSKRNIYKNDTLIQSQSFAKGTTYFLCSEQKFRHMKNTEIVNTYHYDETVLDPTLKLQTIKKYEQGKLRIESCFNEKNQQRLYIDSFIYDQKKMLHKYHTLDSFIHGEKQVEVFATHFDYDGNGLIKKIWQTKMNKQGIVLVDTKNKLTECRYQQQLLNSNRKGQETKELIRLLEGLVN